MIHKLSEQLLYAVKTETDYTSFTFELENIPFVTLLSQNNNDTLKKAFWINIYNAYFQILRKHQNIDKKVIYTQKLIKIAGILFSLDDIEHGILRRFRYKYSLGYFSSLFVKKHIKELTVSKIDYRIHFALNCGAKSCPPIAFYAPEKLESQLSLAETSFIESETEIDHQKKEIKTNIILNGF